MNTLIWHHRHTNKVLDIDNDLKQEGKPRLRIAINKTKTVEAALSEYGNITLPSNTAIIITDLWAVREEQVSSFTELVRGFAAYEVYGLAMIKSNEARLLPEVQALFN